MGFSFGRRSSWRIRGGGATMAEKADDRRRTAAVDAYQGGYDIALEYGQPLAPSAAICYPPSISGGSYSELFAKDRPLLGAPGYAGGGQWAGPVEMSRGRERGSLVGLPPPVDGSGFGFGKWGRAPEEEKETRRRSGVRVDGFGDGEKERDGEQRRSYGAAGLMGEQEKYNAIYDYKTNFDDDNENWLNKKERFGGERWSGREESKQEKEKELRFRAPPSTNFHGSKLKEQVAPHKIGQQKGRESQFQHPSLGTGFRPMEGGRAATEETREQKEWGLDEGMPGTRGGGGLRGSGAVRGSEVMVEERGHGEKERFQKQSEGYYGADKRREEEKYNHKYDYKSNFDDDKENWLNKKERFDGERWPQREESKQEKEKEPHFQVPPSTNSHESKLQEQVEPHKIGQQKGRESQFQHPSLGNGFRYMEGGRAATEEMRERREWGLDEGVPGARSGGGLRGSGAVRVSEVMVEECGRGEKERLEKQSEGYYVADKKREQEKYNHKYGYSFDFDDEENKWLSKQRRNRRRSFDY